MKLMDYISSKMLLEKYGIKTAPAKYVTDANQAIAFAQNKSIVLKVISQKALHKSRNGLVLLDLKPNQIKKGYDNLIKRAKELKLTQFHVLAQMMASSGKEIIVGGNIDEQFGKMILLGLGGIYVETFKDFSVRICPLRKYDYQSMIDQLASKSIIAPDKKSNDMIKGILAKVSTMFIDNDIKELDINPIIIYKDSYTAVDIRIMK